MESAGPSIGQATPQQSTPQLSPKKSPKNRAVKFRQNSNNSSPKRSLNDPSSSNPQNVPLSTPISTLQNQFIPIPIPQNYPSTSGNKSHRDPFPKKLLKIDPFSAAIENCQNKSTLKIFQQNSASQINEVHSLTITVHKNAVPFQRTVQNVVLPQREVQNDATQAGQLVEGDVTPRRPYQSRFPQGRPFEYDPPHIRQPYKTSALLERQQAKEAKKAKEKGNAVHPQRIVQNDVGPQQIVQNNIEPRGDMQNDVQSQRIVQNDVQPQRQQNAMQADGTVQGDVTPGGSYQPRFPQSKRSQSKLPYRGKRRIYKKDVVNPTSNTEAQLNGEDFAQLTYQQRKLIQDQNNSKKVIVSGFPAYTKPEELLRKLSFLGNAQLDTFKNRVAVLAFQTEQEANIALQANETIPVYGTILNITKYTGPKHVMGMIKENKRVLKNEGPPIIAPTQLDLSGDFNQQLQNIEDAIRLTQEEVANINLLFEDIEKYMRMIFPTCEAVPFGSITTGQGIKSSDADCFLSLVPGVDGRPGAGAAELCSQFVNRAARLLRLYPDVFSQLVAIPRANTPIIKFLHVPTNVHCDLNSKTPLGVQNSRLVGHVLRSERGFGSAALVLKYWARAAQLSGTGRLTNYALLLLLLFYLQQNYIPPVYKLQGPEHSFPVENWEAGFDRSPLPFLREVPPLRDLLGGFFLYYANFDFNVYVVCPFLGRPLRKAEFESGALPAQFARYRHNIVRGLALPVRTSSCLCIQDPFELSHNVASAVTCRLAADIKAHLKLAAAAYMQEEKSPGDFLRTILLTHPPAPEGEGAARGGGGRVSLPARLLAELGYDWQDLLRDAIFNIMFKQVLLIELTRKDSVSREHDVDSEVYYGTVTRPIWRRPINPFSSAYPHPHYPPPAGAVGAVGAAAALSSDVLARHQEISLYIQQNTQIEDIHLPFEVEFGFRNRPPRACNICVSPLEGSKEEELKTFRTFVNAFMQRWQRVLLAPHLKVDPTRVPPKAKPPSPKKSPKKTSTNKANEDNSTELIAKPREPSIKTVAFVNSNHKDLSESLAAVSLNDSNQNSTHVNDAS